MNPRRRYALLFATIDTYVRARHRCFVAECFLSSQETEWVICIRPTQENTRLRSSLWERIDRELSFIGDAVPSHGRRHAPFGAPQGMKIGFSWQPRADGSVCATSIVGRRLLGGRQVL